MPIFHPTFILYPSDCRMDGLMFGVLLSYGWHFSRDNRFRDFARRWRNSLLAAGSFCLAPAFIWPVENNPWVSVFGVMSYALGAGMLILGILSFANLERLPLMKPLGKLGTYSYSAYLWHGPLIVLGMQRYFSGKDWLQFVVSFCGTWTLGIVAARIVEIPVLRLRERYFPVHLPSLN